MQERKISIVLPVYNGSKYLAESIESVIAQTYTNWELIIVNDCSTDNTIEIAQKYASKDSRIKVFTNSQNLKLPNTLNEGFEQAVGAYYTWTSDDNKYKPDALRIMAEYLEKNPDIVMVYANLTDIDSAGNKIRSINWLDPKYIFIENMIGACFLYTAEAAKKIGLYDANLFLVEDYDFWIRMYKVGKILHVEEDLYYYRRHEKSLTETKKALVDEQVYKVLDKHFQFAYKKSIENGLCNEFFDHMLNRASAHYDETLKMLLSVNPKYRHHLIWKKVETRWERLKVFIWYSHMWQMLLKLKKAL